MDKVILALRTAAGLRGEARQAGQAAREARRESRALDAAAKVLEQARIRLDSHGVIARVAMIEREAQHARDTARLARAEMMRLVGEALDAIPLDMVIDPPALIAHEDSTNVCE